MGKKLSYKSCVPDEDKNAIATNMQMKCPKHGNVQHSVGVITGASICMECLKESRYTLKK
jgi:hypothetical protein